MTDTDLMNNFMKSLHSHPDEDLPIPSPSLKSQISTNSNQN